MLQCAQYAHDRSFVPEGTRSIFKHTSSMEHSTLWPLASSLPFTVLDLICDFAVPPYNLPSTIYDFLANDLKEAMGSHRPALRPVVVAEHIFINILTEGLAKWAQGKRVYINQSSPNCFDLIDARLLVKELENQDEEGWCGFLVRDSRSIFTAGIHHWYNEYTVDEVFIRHKYRETEEDETEEESEESVCSESSSVSDYSCN